MTIMDRRFFSRAGILALVAALGQGLVVPASAQASSAGVHPPRTRVHCGQTITTSVTVTNDLTCSGNGLLVDADNVTIDLAGHVLRGDGTGVGVTITSQYPDVLTGDTVRDGTIRGFGSAVSLEAVSSTVLDDLTMTDNGRGTSGQVIATDADAYVVNLQVLRSRITGNVGYSVVAGERVRGIIVADTVIEGLKTYVYDNDGPVFDRDVFKNAPLTTLNTPRSTVTHSRFIHSPVLATGTFPGDVYQDDVFTGADVALNISEMFSEHVTDNVFAGNRIGVWLGNPFTINNDSVTGNLFLDNKAVGVLVDSAFRGPMNVTVSGNIGIGNGRAPAGTTDSGGNPVAGAIHIYGPTSGPTVTDNRTVHNSGYGVWTVPGTVTSSGNVSIADQFGCNPADACVYRP